MLKNCRLIALVLVFVALGFEAIAQTNQTNNYKDVLLNGKPAKLNLTTGEVTYSNGEIATSRAAKKIKDSLLSTRTEIQTNLLKDMVTSNDGSETEVLTDSTNVSVESSVDASELSVVDAHETEDAIKSEPEVTYAELPGDSNLKPEGTEAQATSDFHIVEKGENLYAISKRYNTTLNELILANKLDTTLIKPGQSLRVKNFDFSEAEITWIVTRGDTLYSIAKKNNTTVEELRNLNGISGSLIKIGQKLQVNQNSTLTKK